MAAEGPGGRFAVVVVEGAVGPAGLTRALRNKLLRYFQSARRSGGGECELRERRGQVLVCFADERVRQQVLQRKTHELDLGEEGKLTLIVKQLEAPSATQEDVSWKEGGREQALESASRSPEQDGQRKEDPVQHSTLQEKVINVGNIQKHFETTSSQVVLENVKASITQHMLILVLETISGLGDHDFSVERIPEIDVVIVTFVKSIDIMAFVDKCTQHKRIRELNITVRSLELTRSIKAENVPPTVSKAYLTVYFESPKSGGGPVSDVQQLPEENSAIITFCDHKDLNAVLDKQHFLDETPISVYPYYRSLGTALYGKDRPVVEMPKPITIAVDPYLWQFLQKSDRLLQKINEDMARCHCDLKWPQTESAQPEITLSPLVALYKQRRLIVEVIPTWNEDATTAFSHIMSQYKVAKYHINALVWEDIKKKVMKDGVLATADISEEMVVIAGHRLTVEGMEKELRKYMEKTIKEMEKEKQSLEIAIIVDPKKYAILRNSKFEASICKEYPSLKMSYSASTKKISLYGIAAEVYKVKSDILEKVQDMAQKVINIHPQILQFLQHVNNETLSQSLFVTNKINAIYELENDTVVLIGHSLANLLEAEEKMKTNLDWKCIPVEDREVIQKVEWKRLTSSLCRKHNSSWETVVVDFLMPEGREGQVVVTGFSKAVSDVYLALSDFVDRNTKIEKLIQAQSVAVVKFLETENSNIWLDLQKKNVTVNFGTKSSPKSISLAGPRVDVMKGVTVVEQILSTLHAKDVLIDKPGAKAFFRDKEYVYVIEAKQKFKCLIRLQEDGEQESGAVGSIKTGLPLWKTNLPNEVVVAVFRGDLCSYPVDVVVNASNEDLKHLGGLAGALLAAAGPELQTECDHFVRRHGRLQPGCAVITGAGELPCKQVVHAVGPRWVQGEAEKCMHLLKKAVKESLRLAETYNHRSIAIPAISSGIFGFPLERCVHSIATSIKDFLEESVGDSSLKEIHLVDSSEKTGRALTNAFKEVFSNKSPHPNLRAPSKTSQPPRESRNIQSREDHRRVKTNEGLNIILEERDIEDATTDVIVSSIGTDLRLGVGPLSRALLKKAGAALQLEFAAKTEGQVANIGAVFETKGYNLTCGFLFHVIMPTWDQGKGTAFQSLGDIVQQCLKKTQELSLKSVTFPAIGSGGFGFPKHIVAKLMFDEVFKFSSNHNLKSLQEVHFLLHPSDTDNIQAFTDELQCRLGGKRKAAPPNPSFFGQVSTPVLGVHEMQIGSITFQVATGDITKEKADVIVNVSNATFNSYSGVSKAILEAAGPLVNGECAQLGAQRHSGFITTQGGKLMCKNIIHLVPHNSIKGQVSKVLQECELKGYESVTFPAIGTGNAGQNPAQVADDMMDAIGNFASKKTVQHVKKIKIVLFQPHMQNDFYAAMRKRGGTGLAASEPWYSKITSFFSGKKQTPRKKQDLFLKKKIELAIFQICGENCQNVEDTETWLKTMIIKEQSEHTIKNELIEMFSEAEFRKLNELQEKLHITIQIEANKCPPYINLSGITRDVYDASLEIEKMIKRIKDDQEEQSKIELVHQIVAWKYSLPDGTFTAFDPLTNMQLEDAKAAKKPSVDIRVNRKKYTVDMNTLHATDEQGKTVTIQRASKLEGIQSIDLPKEWEDMQQERVKVVQLNQGLPEYQKVQMEFQKTCGFKISKIERIQNPFLWQQYQIKKLSVDNKNGNQNNERCLFHGTAQTSLNIINYNGFNRGFAGKNAAAIGNGTYFAVQANYSAQDTYSRPDINGFKYMYLARVLTGQYCVGMAGMITPPSKNASDPTDLYDSVVDGMNSPSMFVIFNDIQAYPEYLITFKK